MSKVWSSTGNDLIEIKIGSRTWWSAYIGFDGNETYKDVFHFDNKKDAEDKLKELTNDT